MLLPLLMNLDMFTPPPPVTDFRGDVDQALSAVWLAEQSLQSRWVVTQRLAIVWSAKQENEV